MQDVVGSNPTGPIHKLYREWEMAIKFRVHVIESERGWGQRIDEVKDFDDAEEAAEWVRNFNKENNKEEVPDWYMYATPPKLVHV